MMWQKCNDLVRCAYLAGAGLVRDLRRDERGLSGIVVAVLLILIAVLAVVALWGSMSGWLSDLWDQITGAASGIQGSDTL